MDKKLLKAKQELQKYTNIWSVIAICSVLLLILDRLGYLTRSYVDRNFANYMDGFYTGLFIVTIVVAVCYIAKNYNAMKNEKDLMRLYNEMHDERCRQIELMSKRQAFLIAEDLLLVVAVIASFINSYLFAGIIISMIVFIFTSIICREYYKRTYTGEE